MNLAQPAWPTSPGLVDGTNGAAERSARKTVWDAENLANSGENAGWDLWAIPSRPDLVPERFSRLLERGRRGNAED